MREYRFAVTGATGLVGSHLVEHLLASGYDVNIFSGDINSQLDVNSFVMQSKADFFIHLAGNTDTKSAYKRPASVFETNVSGTINVLDALYRHGTAKSIVIASSDRALLDHLSPYGASKMAMESIANSYKSIGLPISIIRFCNIYGPRDYNLHRFIPRIMYSNAYGLTLELKNNGADLRRYIHVIDAVRAILLTLQSSPQDIISIASNESYSNLFIVNKISNILNYPVQYSLVDGTPEKEFAYSNGSLVGWSQTIGIDHGLNNTIEWYKNMYQELDSH